MSAAELRNAGLGAPYQGDVKIPLPAQFSDQRRKIGIGISQDQHRTARHGIHASSETWARRRF